jgi:hypothetical protein
MGGTGSDQLSIDLIDGAAAVCYVTSKELEYMMVQSWEVGVGKRVMPQAITMRLSSQTIVCFLTALAAASPIEHPAEEPVENELSDDLLLGTDRRRSRGERGGVGLSN